MFNHKFQQLYCLTLNLWGRERLDTEIYRRVWMRERYQRNFHKMNR
jgi:hypothetical protein